MHSNIMGREQLKNNSIIQLKYFNYAKDFKDHLKIKEQIE